MSEGLRYEGLFKVDDHIRAYDFEPRVGALDRFLEGWVRGTTTTPGGAKVYVVDVYRDSVPGAHRLTLPDSDIDPCGRVGDECYVPMGLAWFEFDGRVVLSERGEEERLSRTEAAEDAMDDFNYRGSRHHY